MTEIEKLYENAGIKPLCQIPDKFCGVQNIYEDLTAYKQLELIKLLGKRARISLEIDFYNETNFYSDYYAMDGWFEYQSDGETFEEALAQIINNLWQSLTDQEKEEIRNILISND